MVIPKKELKRVWAGLKRVVGKRSTLPVLNHVLVEEKDGKVTFAVTDLEQYLIGTVQSESTGNCRFLVPADEIKELVKGKAVGAISFEPKFDNLLRIVLPVGGQDISREVGTCGIADWPFPAKAIPVSPADIGALIYAYRETAKFASTDTGRWALHGVFLDKENKVAVGTDGRCLLRMALSGVQLEQDVIMPLNKVLDSDLLKGDGEAGFSIEEGIDFQTLRIVNTDWDYRARCIDAKYPNYCQVIPEFDTLEHAIHIAAADLPLLREACSQFPDDDEHGVVLYADAKGVVLLHVASTVTHIKLPNSTATITVPVVMESMNRQFLLCGLGVGFDTIHIRRRDGSGMRAIRFSGHGDDCYVMMPLRELDNEKVIQYMAQVGRD